MRISHRYKFVFLSKNKCASTSMRRLLTPFSDITSSQSYPYYHHTPLAPLKEHFTQQGWRWADYTAFTTVRHPYAMLWSLYRHGIPDMDGGYWWDRHRDKAMRDTPVPDAERIPENPIPFRNWILTADLLPFCLDRFIKDKNGAIAVQYVLRVENLQAEVSHLAAKLNLQLPPVPRMHARGDSSLPSFDETMRTRIVEIFASDIAWGNYQL